MKIGIDLDDTIINTRDIFHKYAKDYAKRFNYKLEDILVNNNSQIIANKSCEFLSNYYEKMLYPIPIKNDAANVIDYFKQLGYEVYIITARPIIEGKNIEEDIKQYLLQNNIVVDNVVAGFRNKESIINKLNIDVMIDDNIVLYNNLIDKNVEILLFDDINLHNMDNSIKSWKEVKEYFMRKER